MTSTELPPPPWPFPTLPAELRFLEDIDQVLTSAQLVEVVRRISQTGLWSDYTVVSQDYRDYRLVFENEFTDIWVLSWLPGQTTGFHDHDRSQVGLGVMQGALRESHMRLGDTPVNHVLRAGQFQEGPFGYIHQVAHEEGDLAVSIHAYSPPLVAVGQYRQVDGRMVRLAEPGRTRLTPG
ncbi:MAG: cysteine dioxygenase family protein [Thermoleophilia bacterium]